MKPLTGAAWRAGAADLDAADVAVVDVAQDVRRVMLLLQMLTHRLLAFPERIGILVQQRRGIMATRSGGERKRW